MLWWGMDETLAELFTRHPNSPGFEGNPMGQITAEIEGARFGPNQTLAKIGLFGGRYTIVFQPGELVAYQCVLLNWQPLLMPLRCCRQARTLRTASSATSYWKWSGRGVAQI